MSIKCTNQDVSRWLQEPTKVGSVSIDTSFELQRVIQNINSEHCETSDRRSVHRDGDDHVVFSVNEGFKMKSPRGDFKNRIHNSQEATLVDVTISQQSTSSTLSLSFLLFPCLTADISTIVQCTYGGHTWQPSFAKLTTKL